ncbi:MAG: repeat-containing protein [Bacteroidetes bacterium]|nr:repeat-containing protein [Bacteroidota bacterium]
MKRLLFFLMAIIFAIESMGQITTFPWTETFDGAWAINTPGNGTSPSGWINVNGGNPTSYNWIKGTNTSRIKSGTGSAEFFGGNSSTATSTYVHSDWLVTPLVTLTGNQRMRFYLSSYASYYGYYSQDFGLYIYNATTNGHDVVSLSDTSLFTPILPTSVVTESTTTNWIEYEINLSNYVGNYRLAFVRNKLKGGAYINIDDLTIETIPTCARPTSLFVSNITANGVDISFTPAHTTDNQWRLYYKKSSVINWDSVDISSSTYSLNGLTPNTAYKYYIKTNCNSGLSDSTSIKDFRTGCPASVSLPIYENFDSYTAGSGYTLLPYCWTRNSDYTYVNTGGFSGNCLYLYSSSNAIPKIVATPQIDNASPINTLSLRFKYKNNGFSDRLLVGVMTNPLDSSTFVVYDTISYDKVGVWEDKEVNFNLYQGSGSYIALKLDVGYAYIDNFEISQIPSCSRPTKLNANIITSNSANISFSPITSNQSSWYLYSKATNDSIWDSVLINTTTYTLTSLNHNTEYSYFVRALCGSNLSEASFVEKFKTSCIGISSFPYSENFDTYGTGSTAYPSCWSRNSTTENSPYINTTNFSAPGALYFTAPSSSPRSLAILSPIDSSVQMNTLRVMFKMYSSTLNNIQVGVMTDPSDWSTFLPVGSYQPNIALSAWEDKEALLDTYVGNGRYIALLLQNSSYNSVYVDNVVVDVIPACARPKSSIVSNITTNSATISWVEGHAGDNTWYLYYKRFTDSNWDSLIIGTTPSFTLSNLQGSTNYQYALKTECGAVLSEPTFIKTFRTSCGAISAFPWIEDFELAWEATAVSPSNVVAPYCWMNLNGSTSLGKWERNTSTSYTNNGTGSAQMLTSSFTSTILHNDWLLTPILSLTGNETLRFWAKGYSTYNDTLEIKVFNTTTMQRDVLLSDTTSTNFVTALAKRYIPSDSYNEYEIDLSPFTGDCRIAFVRKSFGGYRLNIDDIKVLTTPTCKRTSKPVFSNITANSVSVSFTSGSVSDNSWYLYYLDMTTNILDSVLISSSPYTLQNINQNTNYQCYIKTNCSSVLSEKSISNSFRTLCLPISNLPYSETFDSYGTGSTAFPYCWYRTTTYQTNYPYISTTYFSTPGAMYFFASSGTMNIACSPSIDTLVYPINTLRLKFKLKKTSASYQGLEIGVMSSPNDTSSFIKIDSTIGTSSTSLWEDKEIFFTSYSGQGKYIAFRCKGVGATNSFYVDNVEISQIPQCIKPTNVVITNASSNSATFTWTPAKTTDNSWWLYYKKTSATSYDSVSVSLNALPFTLMGLDQNSQYSYYIINSCATDYSEATLLDYFCTSVNAQSSIPWSEGFETIGAASVLPKCWNATNFGSLTNTQTANSNYNRFAHTGTNAATFKYGSNDIFFTQAFDLVAGTTYKFSYWYITDGNSGWQSLGAGVYSAQTSGSYIQNVGIPLANLINTSYQQYIGTYTPSTSGAYYFGVKCQASSSPCWYLTIDDFKLEYGSCGMSSNLVASNLSQTSFDVKWDVGNSSSWQVEYKSVDSVNWIKQQVSIDSISILGLSAGTNYYVRVASLCNSGQDTSIFSSISISTPCNPITSIPWQEGFESSWVSAFGLSDSKPSNCWININGASSNGWESTPYTYSNYVHSGIGSASLYGANNLMGDYLMTPIITLTGNEQISFWAKSNNMNPYPENVWVKAYNVSLNGDIGSYSDTALFTNIASIDSTLPTTWKLYELSIANLVGDYRLVFARNNNIGYYFHLDDVSISTLPSCVKPSSLNVSNIQTNQVDLSWIQAKPTDNAWQVQYRQVGTSNWNVITTSTTNYTLQNLTPNTAYDIAVYTDCGSGAISLGVTKSFRTLCTGTITSIPWSEDFDSYGTGASLIPSCWTRNTTYADRPNIMTGGYSNNCLYYYVSGQGLYAMAITPKFDQSIALNTLKLDFKFKIGGATDTLRIGIMTDTTAASWVQVAAIGGSYTWNDYQVNLSSYSGAGKYIGFKVESDYNAGYARAYLDNLVISSNITCLDPDTLVASNISQTTADITWTAGGSETDWQIKLGNAGTPIDVQVTNYSFINLTPNTQYTAYIRSSCGAGFYSNWIPVTFTTLSQPSNPIVTTSSITTFTHNTATLGGSYIQWSDTVNAVGFEYKTTAATSWTTQTVSPVASPFIYNATSLTPSTQYKVRAYATTNAGNFYGDTVTFTTAAFNAPIVTTDSVKVFYGNTTAKFYGAITQGTESIVARGFEYKTATQDWSTAEDLTATGTTSITATATSLLSGTNYNVRAYAETQSGKTYGAEKNFNATSGIDNIEINSMSVSLYPNPASTTSTLVVKGLVGEAKVIITDVQGRTINTFTMKSINGEATKAINVNEFAKGVYGIDFD